MYTFLNSKTIDPLAETIGYEIVFDEGDIQYDHNRFGFRSEEFENFSYDNVNILFAGCSITYGLGIPNEYSWTQNLTSKIQTLHDKEVKPYNMGYPGLGVDLIIKNIMAFIRNYGQPEYIFMLIPDIAREVKYDSQYVRTYPSLKNLKRGDRRKKFTKSYVYEESLLEASILIHLLEDFCNTNGIKLFWTSWYDCELDDLASIGFNNFFLPEWFELYRPIGEERPLIGPYKANPEGLPYWQIGRDGRHPGTAYHGHLAESFFNEII